MQPIKNYQILPQPLYQVTSLLQDINAVRNQIINTKLRVTLKASWRASRHNKEALRQFNLSKN